jgi:hypothetical protein
MPGWPVFILAVPLCVAGWYALAWCAKQALNQGLGDVDYSVVTGSAHPSVCGATPGDPVRPPYNQDVEDYLDWVHSLPEVRP